MLHRVLCCHHHERLFQRVGVALDSHLHFVHGLEQRRLSLRRGSVNLVRQQEICEDRALFELEVLRVGVVDGYAQHVARQHVAGELQPVETAIHGARQRLRQGGFAYPGTSSIKRWPRASRHTTDRRTTSGLPRIEVLSDISNSFSFESASGAATITVIVLC